MPAQKKFEISAGSIFAQADWECLFTLIETPPWAVAEQRKHVFINTACTVN
jgi:hypothetical protein